MRTLNNRGLAFLTIAVTIAAPAAQAHRIRFDVNPAKTYVRAVAGEVRTLVPPGAVVAVLDKRDNGFWALLVRYELGRHALVRGIAGEPLSQPDALRPALETSPVPTHAWVHVPEAAIEAVLGTALTPRTSHLLERRVGTWHLVRSWPWPDYDDPHLLND